MKTHASLFTVFTLSLILAGLFSATPCAFAGWVTDIPGLSAAAKDSLVAHYDGRTGVTTTGSTVDSWTPVDGSGTAIPGMAVANIQHGTADASHISYDGSNRLTFTDPGAGGRYLEGSLTNPASTDFTVLWLGHYERNAPSPNHGNYAYNIGPNNISHQRDDYTAGFRVEMYNGTTYPGDDIQVYDGVDTIWSTVITVDSHAAYANGKNLNIVGSPDNNVVADASIIMGSLNSSGYDFVGDIRQMIIFNSALSNADRLLVESYIVGLNLLTWTTTGGEVTITDCNPLATGELVIPDTIEGNPVTSIGAQAFSGCVSLTRIAIPDSVTSIGQQAFYECSSLTHITIPDGVTSIKALAFSGCTVLTSVTIGNGVTSIGEYAFRGTPGLTNIIIPDSVISIGQNAFQSSGLTGITIPERVTTIGINAFSGCTSLAGVTFGDDSQLASIGNSAFSSCSSLTRITIPDGVTSIGPDTFKECIGLTSITFGENSLLDSIGRSAFADCSSLKSITIPDGVTSIGDYPFYRCTSLTTIAVGAGNVNYSSVDGVLFNKSQTTILQYPAGKSEAAYTIPDSVTSIGDSAFYLCTSLTSITFGENSLLASIGNSAFSSCSSLTRITIPDGVTSIGPDTFKECIGLTSITFGENSLLDSIGDWAFNGCSSLGRIICWRGAAPTLGTDVFAGVHATAAVYTLASATGYGATYGGLPVLTEAHLTQITALEAQVTVLETTATSNATVIATLELRPTLAEVQDARLGSVVLIKNEAGEINFDFKLEETGDLLSWTPVAGGTWTNPGDGGVEVDLPLAGDKRFYRVVVEFQ